MKACAISVRAFLCRWLETAPIGSWKFGTTWRGCDPRSSCCLGSVSGWCAPVRQTTRGAVHPLGHRLPRPFWRGAPMLVGNAPCSWGVNYPTGNVFSWEQYLDQVAEAGYRATELGPLGFLPRDPSHLKDELGRRGLALIGATHVHTFGDA